MDKDTLRDALRSANKAMRATPTQEQRARIWASIQHRVVDEQERPVVTAVKS